MLHGNLALSLFYAHVAYAMQPRASSSSCPKPDSVLAVVNAVRRQHFLQGIPFQEGTLAFATAVNGGCKQAFVEVLGPKALMPKRTEPMAFADLDVMLRLQDRVGTAVKSRRIQPSPFWRSFFGALKAVKMTGWRLDEFTLSRGQAFGLGCLSYDNIVWYLKATDTYVTEPSLKVLQELRPGDVCMVRPGIAKNDRLGSVYGNFPIYMEFRPGEFDNAAAALRDIELRHPVQAEHLRQQMPLFSETIEPDPEAPTGYRCQAFRGTVFRPLFSQVVSITLGPLKAALYTPHSPRVGLACVLYKLGYTADQIQRYARWKSSGSVLIYGRETRDSYIDTMRRVRAVATVDQRQLANVLPHLPQIDPAPDQLTPAQ
jgi:hypothetical protein